MFAALSAFALFLSAAVRAQCPDFASYSTSPQGTPSTGPIGLPFMRPAPECRTFNSTAVEKVVENMTSRMMDADLARLFENTYTNTLDTTIKWFNEDLTFVVTGDIPAEWLRDSCNQFKVYLPLVGQDKPLQELTRGVINLQARYITEFPYCNAFQPPPESGLPAECCSGDTGASVSPPENLTIVWTCGYELDSLLSFLQLSRLYFQYSSDKSIFTFDNGGWFTAVEAILQVIAEQAVPTYDADGNVVSFYNISGPNQQYMKNDGRGPPKANVGLIGTTYRPSGAFNFLDPCIRKFGKILYDVVRIITPRQDCQHIAKSCNQFTNTTSTSWNICVFHTSVMDLPQLDIVADPNVPSLVSIPHLGFMNATDPIYQNTRKMVLSTTGNPYYGFGPVIRGVSSPHIDEKHVWPMGLVTEVFTDTDDADILVQLEYLKDTTTGLGLMHESVNTHNVEDYTRPWL
ncbi:hypothetical protein C8R45DRAFT_1055029 [Mycena sanguinolenta]|nr:hypothetical protein C8R45DRAFT_1055029 [Mycena sanguinolenta]